MALSAIELYKLWALGFLLTMHMEMNTKKKKKKDHAQIAVDAVDTQPVVDTSTWWITVILIIGKTWIPQVELHAGKKWHRSLGSPSILYLWFIGNT